MSGEFSLGELARRVGGRVHGDPDRRISGVETLDRAGPDRLAFLTNPKYRKAAAVTRAGAVLVGPGTILSGPDLLEAPEPYAALAEILALFHPEPAAVPGVSADARLGEGVLLGTAVAVGPYAVIGNRSILGDRCVIGPACVIGEDCVIGERTILAPRVVLYPGTVVGARCRLHAGVVLGADGFGFATVRGEHRKVPQVGRVVVEDDVEIGANSTVDRAMLGETVVGRGSKIDDQVMIAHGVRIGPRALLAAQSGIAGSTRLGENVTFAGQSGAAGHLEIGDRAIVAAKTAVFEDVPAGAFVAGIPAVDHRSWKRTQAMQKRLPDWRETIRSLERRVEALEAGTKKGETS